MMVLRMQGQRSLNGMEMGAEREGGIEVESLFPGWGNWMAMCH
jgi:hypothetical protein